jgi:hypothetical protein
LATRVIQSQRRPLPHGWLAPCLESVRGWAELRGFEYRFLDDALFDVLPADLREKTRDQLVVASDIARLIVLRQALAEGHDTVIWCDSDFLVFDPQRLTLPPESYAVGREIWVQSDGKRLRSHIKVHNAFLAFRHGNAFLDFYLESAQKLVRAHRGPMVPQFVGPKLLTAIHNIVGCPVAESAAMLSPEVARDVVAGSGPALALFNTNSRSAPAAVNLCASLAGTPPARRSRGRKTARSSMRAVIERLLSAGWPS